MPNITFKDFDKLILIEKEAQIPDENGGHSTSFEALLKTWGKCEPIKSSSHYEFNNFIIEEKIRVYIRVHSIISTNLFINLNNKRYRIIELSNLTRNYLKLTAVLI